MLIAERGKVVYERSFGYSDLAGKRKITRDTLFPVASISKTITATAILQQVGKGKLRLDDPAAKYLPDFPYKTITVRHLLSHTSGLLPYNAFFDAAKAADTGRVFTNADYLAVINSNKKPLKYEPGESWNYDNVNYIVLALILEKVTGETYSEYVKRHILLPAGMHRTLYFPNYIDASGKKVKGLAIPQLIPFTYSEKALSSDTVPYISNYWRPFSSMDLEIMSVRRTTCSNTTVPSQAANW